MPPKTLYSGKTGVYEGRYGRVSAKEKSEIIALVTGSELPCRRALAQLGLPRSTYYRWLKRQTEGRLEDRKGGSSIPWNKISPEEETRVLLGTLLNVKPILTMRQGEIVQAGMARSCAKGIERLFEFVKGYPNLQEVAIAHSMVPEEAKALKKDIASIIAEENGFKCSE